MAQNSFHQSKCINYHLIWFSIFFAILGFVQSCEVWEYHYRSDRSKSTIPRDFLVDLKRNIDSIESGNEIKIIEILATQNKSQLARIVDCYNDCYHQDLITVLKDKFTGKLEQIVVALLTPEMKYSVKLIHDAMVGVESDSCALIDILCTKNKRKLEQIRAEYQKMYRTRLTTDLDKYNIGKFKKLLGALMRWSRDESTTVNTKLAKTDAQKLNSGRDIFSTDRSLMDALLVTGSFSRIRQAVYRYYSDYKEYYESRIAKKYGGDVRRALITIVRWSKGQDSFYAEKLHDSLKFVGTDDHSLIRIIVENFDNMGPIKKAYKKRYHMTLEKAITDKLSGPYADALICLITKGQDKAESIEKESSEEEKEEEKTEEEKTEEEKTEEDDITDESDEKSTSQKKRKFSWCVWC